jgi:hypothetical protein
VQLSVNFSICGGGDKVKLLGEIISTFFPGIDLLHRWENGPGGVRTRWSLASLRDFGCRFPLRSRLQSASTLTESYATVAPWVIFAW